MNLFLARTWEAVQAHLSPAGRDRARRMRQAEIEATVAAERMHIARLLATVGDYHLSLAPAMLRARRSDVGIAHFTHCPWADPGYFAMLPSAVGAELLDGMLGADLLGFLVPRWARNFLRCCQDSGYVVDRERGTIQAGDGRTVLVRAYPLGVAGTCGECGTQIMCTKGGSGQFSCHGAVMGLNAAKPLPSSD